MGKINGSNFRKTIYYLKRNGVGNTWNAIWERLSKKEENYAPVSLEAKERAAQQKGVEGFDQLFSIVVPAYRTKREYLTELIESLLRQTYENWELILADATEDESVEAIVRNYGERDKRIRYHRLESNQGISENTNRALEFVCGSYVGLLDHDDLLTEDALFEMAAQIASCKKEGISVDAVYSDEDKCDGDGKRFYECNRKEDFNPDLLLSNNYICHFLVMKSEKIKELGFRKEYDGAQDYDLLLRGADEWLWHPEQVAHVPRVLYHWRCHSASTAENPRSKEYAYEAGRRALQDFADRNSWDAHAEHMMHLGFYQLQYAKSPLHVRKDLGAVGGSVRRRRKLIGGRYGADGRLYYEELKAGYSGYLHRAVLAQDAEAVDLRCIQLAEKYWSIFEKITGVPYVETTDTRIFDAGTMPQDADWKGMSLELGEAIRNAGGRILYLPSMTVQWK